MSENQEILERLRNAISRAVAPPMERARSLEILEDLQSDIEGSIEALKEEMEAEAA